MRDIHFPGRSPAYGKNSMVATSHPSATLAAVEILKKGGNAVDAAVTAAAVLGVVESHSTGIGGDMFCLYCPSGSSEAIAMNASGRVPKNFNIHEVSSKDGIFVDPFSHAAITVPYAVAGWDKLVKDYGNLNLNQILSPAIDFAENGYVVADVIADMWNREREKLSRDIDCAEVFLNDGRPYLAGELHFQPKLANTLKKIADNGRDGFYKGSVARDIIKKINSVGGRHTIEDLESAEVEYVSPLSTDYRGYKILECPPNGQGIIALIILNILSGFDMKNYDPNSAMRIHLEAESTKLAFINRYKYLADPTFSEIPLEQLLSKKYTDYMRSFIEKDKTIEDNINLSLPDHKDTVYISIIDKEKNCISLINSIFQPFGSGLLCPESGVLLHNRGASFNIDSKHPNVIAANKRPMHTIIPGMMLKDNSAIMPFGVMGSHYQPVGQAHLLTNIIDYDMDVQSALDHSRTFYFNNCLSCEKGISRNVLRELEQLGHKIEIIDLPHGGGQAVYLDKKKNILVGGSDPRKDGIALGF